MTTYGPDPATVVKVTDGDTVEVLIDYGWNTYGRWRCRLLDINAPEKDTDAGKAAKAFVEGLLPVGTKVLTISKRWDEYGGRYDGRIVLEDGRDLAEVIRQAGHAAAYAGGKIRT